MAGNLFGKALAVLTGKTPAEQLAQIRERIATAEGEVGRLQGEIDRRAMAIMTGDVEAARVAAQLERDKQDVLGELATMRAAEADRVTAVRAEEEAARRAAAAALPEQIAVLNGEMLQADDEIEATAEQLAAAFKRRLELAQQHAALVGSDVLARVNVVLPHRVRSAIANKFRLDPSRAHSDNANNLLGLVSEPGGRGWMSLRELDQDNLDDEAPFYLTAAEAEAARERQAKRGMAAAVVPIGRCFTVERQDHMFTDRATAEATVQAAARVGHDLVVVPHGPGWLVRARRFADAAIAAG